MMTKSLPTLVDALSKHYPEISWYANGDPNVYDNIVTEDSTLPDEQELRTVWFEMVKQTAVECLSEQVESMIMAGFVSEAIGEPRFYDADIVDQINLIGALLITSTGASMPYASRSVATGVKEYIIHSPEQMAGVLNDAAQWKLYHLMRFDAKRQYIFAIPYSETAVDEVQAVTWWTTEVDDDSTLHGE